MKGPIPGWASPQITRRLDRTVEAGFVPLYWVTGPRNREWGDWARLGAARWRLSGYGGGRPGKVKRSIERSSHSEGRVCRAEAFT